MLFQTLLQQRVGGLAVPSAGQTHGHTNGSGTSAPCPAVSRKRRAGGKTWTRLHDQHQPPRVGGSGKAIEPERGLTPRHSHQLEP